MDKIVIPLDAWADSFIPWLATNFRDFFQMIKTPVEWTFDVIIDSEDVQHLLSDNKDSREQLAALDPGNAGWQRDLIVSYAKLAGMQPGAGWWAKGLAVAEKLASERRLAPVDMWMVEDLREKAAAEAAE